MTSLSSRRLEITEFGSTLLSNLTRLANSHLSAVSPGWQLAPQQVEAVLSGAHGFWRLRYPDREQAGQETLCVTELVRLAAAARLVYTHPSPGTNSESPRLEAHLSWLFADPEDDAALGLLIDELVARAVRRGCSRVWASTRCDFGIGWFNLPDTWPHLIRGLQRAGFETVDRWVMLTSDIGPPEPAEDPPIRRRELHWEVSESSLEWRLEARRDGEVIGECEAWGIPPYLKGCPGYSEWVTLEWLNVAESYRRRGIGRFLLQEQLRAQAERGVKHAMLWAESGNLAARRFCDAAGFSPRTESWRLVKRLG